MMTWVQDHERGLIENMKNCRMKNTKEDLQEEIKKHTEIAESEILESLNKFLKNTGLVPESVEFKYLGIKDLCDGTTQYVPTTVALKATT